MKPRHVGTNGIKNRDIKRAPKRGYFWCCGCDMQLVAEVRKCPVCGQRANSKRLKKETNA